MRLLSLLTLAVTLALATNAASFGTGEGVTIDGQAIDLYTGRAG
jgi:hypothetical protein